MNTSSPVSVQLLSMVAMLFGGLAFFLYGMSAMSDGLEKMAGGGLERTLRKVTKNQFLGFALGAGITVAIQSSSAMTVMLVGLVNSGIVAFADSFGIIRVQMSEQPLPPGCSALRALTAITSF